MTNIKYVIGIDPGVNTGVAVKQLETDKIVAVKSMPIHDALVLVLKYGEQAHVVIEDARQRKWINDKGKNERAKRGLVMGAGSVKRDAKIWEDAMTAWKISHQMIRPRRGMTKWKADYFAKVTGFNLKTNEHGRDAAGLIMGMSRGSLRVVGNDRAVT